MREKQMETKNIFSRKIAYELRKRGFEIVKTEPNRNKPQLDMYVFEVTPEFQKALNEILA